MAVAPLATGLAVAGASSIGSSLLSGFGKKKYKKPARASGAVYGYDAYGNLVNKGSFQYNSATGQYELKAGELSGPEKEMRANLAGNIANLINTVGTTPDAFVRYAKELSDSYYRQGERKLTEQYEKAQSRLDESLARRGLSTSRAAADITGELQGQRMDTLADIYDSATRYGFNAQSQLQNQAISQLGALRSYQGQLANIDQNYLSQALAAQAQGQAIENTRAGVANQNIAQHNALIDNIAGGINQLGSIAGYYFGSQAPTQTTPVAADSRLSLGMTPNASQFNNVGGTPTGFLSATYGNPGLGWV